MMNYKMKKLINYKQNLSFLFISSDDYPPFRVDLTILFGKEMVGRGHQIDWILQSNENKRLIRIENWEGGKAWVAGFSNISLIGKLCKHIAITFNDFKVLYFPKKHAYDFIQVKDKFVSALTAIISCWLYKLPFLYWLSYPFPEAWIEERRQSSGFYGLFRYYRGRLSKFLLYSIILKQAKHVFVQSEQMKRDIFSHGISDKKMTVMPMGIARENIPEICPYQFQYENNNLLYIGIFYKVRKLEFLIEMFDLVQQEIPDTKFYFIGKGEDENTEFILKNKMNERKLAHKIIFTGFLPLEDALEYVRKATVCVSSYYPSFILNSTSPTKLIEYMAMGKAVVGNYHPEQKEIITESGGGICVPYDQRKFADAVIYLLKNPRIAHTMGCKGREYVLKKRTYSVIASDLERKYYEILQNKTY